MPECPVRNAPALFRWVMPSSHQVDAGGGAQGGRYRRKDGNGEVYDFLPKFFFHSLVFS